jgi:hypothetical protein
MTQKITVRDIEDCVTELNIWSEEYGRRHDLRPQETHSSVEGAAIADAMLAHLGIDETDLTEYINQTTSGAAEQLLSHVMHGSGMLNLNALFGSIWLAAFSAGVLVGRKFPKS